MLRRRLLLRHKCTLRKKIEALRFSVEPLFFSMEPLFCPKVYVLFGHLHVIVVSPYIFDTLPFEFRDALWMQDEFFESLIDTLVSRPNVDDWAQFRLMDDLIVFWFTSSDTDNAFRHGKQGIHGRCIGVELVENGIGTFHHLLVFCERHRFCDVEF